MYVREKKPLGIFALYKSLFDIVKQKQFFIGFRNIGKRAGCAGGRLYATGVMIFQARLEVDRDSGYI
jgi:hypothetical protein